MNLSEQDWPLALKSIIGRYLILGDKQSLRASVLDSELPFILRRISLIIFRGWQGKATEEEVEAALKQRAFFVKAYGEETVATAEKINAAKYKRDKRAENYIEQMLWFGSCVFVTLTFRDDVLKVTSKDTRRKYVLRYLKSQSEYYIANIDYGAKNGREHYHAVVCADTVDVKGWNYGAMKAQKVGGGHGGKVDTVRIGKYIAKLTHHAIKATTKSSRIIYSRNPDLLAEYRDPYGRFDNVKREKLLDTSDIF